MSDFKDWLYLSEAILGHLTASVMGVVAEGRKEPEKLRNRKTVTQEPLFAMNHDTKIWTPDKKVCPLTPLSGYKSHIEKIQKFAFASPENFAQTMMFSPLSANVSFSKHWDNFHVLMIILKHYFPHKVNEEDLRSVLNSFTTYMHSLKHTISGFKIDTICYIWNNRESLMQELVGLNKEGDDVKMISRLAQIPGVQSVKAGFIIQLLFGRAGCIDTHNIDIYSKVFPDLRGDLDIRNWSDDEKGPKNYANLLDKLNKRGIGTQQLWDVWVDFVENFYKITSPTGIGTYADMGPSLDINDPLYQALKDIKIPKTRTGRTKYNKEVEVPVVSGRTGMGASATHIQVDPDEMLKNFHKMYNLGEPGDDAARAVPFHVTSTGAPLDRTSGIGSRPSALHYFGQAVSSGGIDHDHIKHIIRKRIEDRKKRQGLLPTQHSFGFNQAAG